MAVAWIVFAGVILTFATALIGFAQTRRKIAEVHILVNSQLHAVLDCVTQLTAALADAGVDVPEPPTGAPPTEDPR
jgi:uroporphyrinogen-III decarboxylase